MKNIDETGGIHDPLLFIILELDDLVRNWPPRHDTAVCQPLAHDATKHLPPIEVHATLLAGPPAWRRQKIEACKAEGLEHQLQPLLEKALAAGLSSVLAKWVKWDIRKLRERRKEALQAGETARAKAEAEASGRRVPYRRPTAGERADRTARIAGSYQPPGKPRSSAPSRPDQGKSVGGRGAGHDMCLGLTQPPAKQSTPPLPAA